MKKMSCLFYCCTKRTYFYAFLFLYRFFDNSSDHGMISSSKSAVSLFPVILVSMYSIYSYGFTLCPRCRSEFMGIADNIVRRVDLLQVEKECCDKCQVGYGYDYMITKKIRYEGRRK